MVDPAPAHEHPQLVVDRLHRDLCKVADAFIHAIHNLGNRIEDARRQTPAVAWNLLQKTITELEGMQMVLLLCPFDRFEPARSALYSVRESLKAAELVAANQLNEMRKADLAARGALGAVA